MEEHQHQVPKIARQFLEWFCPGELYESIQGDLLERFIDDVETKGVKAAKRRYCWNTLRFFHPDILLRNSFKTPSMNLSLLRNHSKLTFRNLVKGKLYSVINITGLSIGMAACILILCFGLFYVLEARIWSFSESGKYILKIF